jgi:hypothetical protein
MIRGCVQQLGEFLGPVGDVIFPAVIPWVAADVDLRDLVLSAIQFRSLDRKLFS